MLDHTPAKIGRPCTICSHADRGAIDSGLIGGSPISRLSLDFNVSPDSIRRHARAHLAPEARAALVGPQGLAPADLAERVLDVANSARDARQGAEDAGQGLAALKAGAAEIKALDLLMSRLGVDDLELLDQVRDGERLATAVGMATRSDPALGRALASRLRVLGSTEMATALDGHALSSETQLSKAVQS